MAAEDIPAAAIPEDIAAVSQRVVTAAVARQQGIISIPPPAVRAIVPKDIPVTAVPVFPGKPNHTRALGDMAITRRPVITEAMATGVITVEGVAERIGDITLRGAIMAGIITAEDIMEDIPGIITGVMPPMERPSGSFLAG